MQSGNISIDAKNIMPVIKRWLYSDKDIFLREIVANGCDAIKKYQSLCMIGEAENDNIEPRIDIVLDKDEKTLTVSDNGLGMTEEEVEKYITQVAFSGAQEFIEKYKDIILNIQDVEQLDNLTSQENRIRNVIKLSNFVQILSISLVIILAAAVLSFSIFFLRSIFNRFWNDIQVKKLL